MIGDGTHVNRLFALLRSRGEEEVAFWHGRHVTCASLLRACDEWEAQLSIQPGGVYAYRSEYSPNTLALMLSLMRAGAVLVPLARSTAVDDELLRIGAVEHLIEIDADDQSGGIRHIDKQPNRLLDSFRFWAHAGLIIFTSGSSGTPKAILHDFERVLSKFAEKRTAYRTLQFLLIDHFGGINTLLSVLSYSGVVVMPEDRSPGHVGRLIEQARVELMPVTPTFLKLFVASGAHRKYDMSSVQVITYGTEVMPEATLQKVRAAFPSARLQQTYGLSEVGVLRSKSRESDSLWMRLGGTGFETRVVDGVLHIRSQHAMVGYMNAESPFDEEGWLDTGDRVVQEGEWLRVLGRDSDMINVGGQKVFPAEVESVLMAAENVEDATVRGEPHPLLGNVVVADVTLGSPESDEPLRRRLRRHCLDHLPAYKVPMRFQAIGDHSHTARFKKQRGRIED